MSGPIVRSAPSEKFTSNWSQAFSSKEATASKKATRKTTTSKKAAAKAKSPKKAKKKG